MTKPPSPPVASGASAIPPVGDVVTEPKVTTCPDCAQSCCSRHTPRSEKVCPTCLTNMLPLANAYFCDRCEQAWSVVTGASS